MATVVKLMTIGKLVELAIRRAGIAEASTWIRELINRWPKQVCLFNAEAKPENIAAVIHGISYVVVTCLPSITDEDKKSARAFLEAIKDIALENNLEASRNTVDPISAMENALGAC